MSHLRITRMNACNEFRLQVDWNNYMFENNATKEILEDGN